jgi:transcriptional regulator with XRE-family HTH domain
MSAKTANEKIIFGLKVKQLRQGQGLSFSDLSKTSGMSLSYLNEIEKGKKFPKQDKVKNLAKALGTTKEELTDGQLGRNLAPVTQLLQSNFLNELPLELFGIELSKVADLIAQAPTRVGAFISTLLELSRSYALREENFYFAALRSYLELHDNYFPELEEAVELFTHKHGLPGFRPVPPRTLGGLLESAYGYTIVPDGLNDHPDLQIFRSVYQPKENRLLLNGDLTPGQRGFQYGKELAFNHLRLTERANTSSLLRSRVFEEVLNHSKATYFSVALHIPLQPFVESIRAFFARPAWDAGGLLRLMQRYNATPEMFYQRLTNVLPQFFDLPELFFLRFLHDAENDDFTIDKELHLHRRHHPHENGLFEHYCRRWVSLSILNEAHKADSNEMRVDVQRSNYFGTDDEYLCITLARKSSSAPGQNVSLTIGLLVNDKLKETISWLDDPGISSRIVNTTCERCPITDCTDRVAAPEIVNKRAKYQRVKAALKEL